MHVGIAIFLIRACEIRVAIIIYYYVKIIISICTV